MHDRLLIIRSQARHAAPSLLAAGHFIQTTYRSLINTRDRINDGDNTESLSTNCVCFGIHSSREFFFKKTLLVFFKGLVAWPLHSNKDRGVGFGRIDYPSRTSRSETNNGSDRSRTCAAGRGLPFSLSFPPAGTCAILVCPIEEETVGEK
jgi:hypothetical protein